MAHSLAYRTHADNAVEARIGMLAAALLLIGAQLEPLFARLEDGVAEMLPDATLVEARLIVIELEQVIQIALREAGQLLRAIRPLGISLQTSRIFLIESSIAAQTLLDGALLAAQQRPARQLQRRWLIRKALYYYFA